MPITPSIDKELIKNWLELCWKDVDAVWFSEECVSFHYKMFDVTNFILGLGVCIFHVVIFIKTYVVNLPRISFQNCKRYS